ncbi:MAG: putative 4-hydroxybenzoate polyprenyltransferase [Bacteroidia bacterium]|nr:putative 4-hydroxybenzoate polyprenyltransferase [Bacteroidia bacterium]
MKIKKYARLVALSHSVFAFPFALWGFALGYKASHPTSWGWKLFWVIAAVVSARTAAMAFNRYADREIDAQNPRTAQREIPRGEVRPWEALGLAVGSAAVFGLSAWMLSPVCGLLSPVALLILLGYSYTKRFTFLSHYVLGIALGLAPIGAYIAMTDKVSYEILLIGMAVALWVGGFDILYALQDEEFDKMAGLYSLPAVWGEKRARLMALISHALAILLLATVGYRLAETVLYWIGWGGFAAFVLYQHRVSQDKSRINRAFFTYNGLASVVFGGLAMLSTFFL